MKRKIAYLLVGVLALSPVSASAASLKAHADIIVADDNTSENDSSISESDDADTAADEAAAPQVSTDLSDISIQITIKNEDGEDVILTDEKPLELTEGESVQPGLLFADQDAAAETEEQAISTQWSSDHPEIISVDAAGKLTAESAGEAEISVEISEGEVTSSLAFTVLVLAEENKEEAVPAADVEETEAAAEDEIAEKDAQTPATADEEAEESEKTTTADDTQTADDIPLPEETSAAEDAQTTEEALLSEEDAAAETVESAEEIETSEAETEGTQFTALQASVSTSGASYSWVSKGSSYTYQDAAGNRKTGWVKYNDRYYYLDASGIMQTGWVNVDGKYYYLTKSGAMQTGWITLGSGKFYLDSNGVMQTGWQEISGTWYYFNSWGSMRTGWAKIGSSYYYFDQNGIMKTGWQQISGTWYYFNSWGPMRTGWAKIGSSYYYFNNSGSMKTGWVVDGGSTYYMDSWGPMRTGWAKISGSYYYFNRNGVMQTGWTSVGDDVYYLNSAGKMLTGVQKINGSTYVFQNDGRYITASSGYSNTQEFIAIIAPLVKAYAPQYGVKVYSPIIAQAILESASGQSTLGKNYNNFFGLKCGTLWTGKSVAKRTGEEYTVGNYTTITANFRVYDSIPEGVKGYFEFLFNGRTRYNNLKGVTSPLIYLQNIKADGYATSSSYVKNLMRVIDTYNLTAYDD